MKQRENLTVNPAMDPAIRCNQNQCLLAMFSAAIVVLCVCVGVTKNLVTIYDENFDHMGIRTFCMFTVNSNILAALAMILALPYTIDGLRTGNYHLPNWIVNLMLDAVTAVALTFLVSLFVLAPAKGFVLIFTGSRFFLHGVCPVLAIVTFCFFISDHRIGLLESLKALIPVLIYALIYLTMVVVIGEERGGWNDFYGFATRLPLWLPIVLIMPLTFGITTLLRVLHNGSYERRRRKEAQLYREAYRSADLGETVEKVARSRRRSLRMANIVIPVRVIRRMIDSADGDLDLREGCRRYLDAYLENNEP